MLTSSKDILKEYQTLNQQAKMLKPIEVHIFVDDVEKDKLVDDEGKVLVRINL